MKAEKIRELSAVIAEMATGGGMFGQGTTLTVQYGYVNDRGLVQHDGVLITDAGARVTRELVQWAESTSPKAFAAISHGGLLIT